MSQNYDSHLYKLVSDSIEIKGYMVDLLAGIKELSGKLDTLIALETAAIQLRLQQQPPQQ